MNKSHLESLSMLELCDFYRKRNEAIFCTTPLGRSSDQETMADGCDFDQGLVSERQQNQRQNSLPQTSSSHATKGRKTKGRGAGFTSQVTGNWQTVMPRERRTGPGEPQLQGQAINECQYQNCNAVGNTMRGAASRAHERRSLAGSEDTRHCCTATPQRTFQHGQRGPTRQSKAERESHYQSALRAYQQHFMDQPNRRH